MTPEKLTRLAELQQKARRPCDEKCVVGITFHLTEEEGAELEALRRELAAAPEVADDPATLFVDEARRPELAGGDYFQGQLKRDVRETAEDVGRAAGKGFLFIVGEFLKGLFRRGG